ncbi:MAG: hypothetical protein H7318_00755 [Oligoflexus sp.]|nr:hypothetical protein [Oligoflexus sp.]
MLKRWKFTTNAISIFFAGICMSASFGLQAQTRSQVTGDTNAKQAQTLYLRADIGTTTFDSKAAASKDSHSSTTFEVGGWFGESRIVGLGIRNQIDVVPFTLNKSESATNFTDVRLKARLWGIIPSVGWSLSEVDIKRADVKTIGLFGTGMNAGLGGTLQLYPGIVLNGDYMVVKSTHMFDKLAGTTKLGDRQEADLHIAFDITDRLLDLLVGYRVRSYEIITDAETFKEKAQGIYAGVRLGIYF